MHRLRLVVIKVVKIHNLVECGAVALVLRKRIDEDTEIMIPEKFAHLS